MNITIFTDNSDSWFVPYGEALHSKLQDMGHNVTYVHCKEDIMIGDICFLLSCTKIIQKEYIKRNTHCIVVHASDLPRGKGFSPLQWQILEGENTIPLTLFEVVEAVDAGPWYIKSSIKFNGMELFNELRERLADKIIEMCVEFVQNHGKLIPQAQVGAESFYPKRTVAHDELDIAMSIQSLFNHFRIADNDRYPLYFKILGNKYYLKIYPDQKS